MELGVRIRAIRQDRGLSQEELAHRAGLSLKSVYFIETGRSLDPHWSSLKNIAGALGVPVRELIEAPAPLGEAAEGGSESSAVPSSPTSVEGTEGAVQPNIPVDPGGERNIALLQAIERFLKHTTDRLASVAKSVIIDDLGAFNTGAVDELASVYETLVKTVDPLIAEYWLDKTTIPKEERKAYSRVRSAEVGLRTQIEIAMQELAGRFEKADPNQVIGAKVIDITEKIEAHRKRLSKLEPMREAQ